MLVAPFTMVEIWNKLGYPQMDDWIKKIWSMYAVEYYSAINKDGFFFYLQQNGCNQNTLFSVK